MTTADLPLFDMLRTRMRWHQERTKMLAENVANAETPGYRARDLRAPTFSDLVVGGAGGAGGGGGPVVTDQRHIGGSSGASRFDVRRNAGVVTTPDANSVNLEDEMLKVAQNQMDYQAVTGLYQRSLGLLRTAMGRRGN